MTKKRSSDPDLGENRFNKELDHFPECGIGSDHRCVVCEELFHHFHKKYPEKCYKDIDCKSIKTSFRYTGCTGCLPMSEGENTARWNYFAKQLLGMASAQGVLAPHAMGRISGTYLNYY